MRNLHMKIAVILRLASISISKEKLLSEQKNFLLHSLKIKMLHQKDVSISCTYSTVIGTSLLLTDNDIFSVWDLLPELMLTSCNDAFESLNKKVQESLTYQLLTNDLYSLW